LGLLLGLREGCLQLGDLELKGLRIDLEQDGSRLHGHIRPDRDRDHLAGDVGRDLHDPGHDHEFSRGREVIEHRQEHGEDERADEPRDVKYPLSGTVASQFPLLPSGALGRDLGRARAILY
jgi:hypothetical protein